MVKSLVLDASAMVAFFKSRERGHERVKNIIKDPDTSKEAHALNMMELYTIIYSGMGRARAVECLHVIEALGITVAEDMDPEFWQDMAYLKTQFPGAVSMGDAAPMALSRKRKVTLLGSDSAAFVGPAKASMLQLKSFR